jgi:hypothetical protein
MKYWVSVWNVVFVDATTETKAIDKVRSMLVKGEFKAREFEYDDAEPATENEVSQ